MVLEDLPVYHSKVLMGAGRPPCLPHSHCVFTPEQDNEKINVEPVHSYDAFHTGPATTGMHRFNICLVLLWRETTIRSLWVLGDLPAQQSGPYGCWFSWETSLSPTQSGPYGCWVSWETSLSTTQSGPYGCWFSWETSLSTTQSGPYGCWVSWGTSLSTTQ